MPPPSAGAAPRVAIPLGRALLHESATFREVHRRGPGAVCLWDRPYQAGRSKHWVKVKNRRHPAMDRVMEAFS